MSVSLKISSFLHDPLDKSLCFIVGIEHAPHAAEIAKRLVSEIPSNLVSLISTHHSSKAHKVISWADRNASAANRGLIPSGSAVNVLAFQNPFSAYLKEIGGMDSSLKNILEEQVPSGFGTIATYDSKTPKVTFNNIFRGVIREYYGVYGGVLQGLEYLIPILSEDTRFPDSPIFSHLSMTSALSTTGSNFYLLFFDIGGVGPFISAGRKTRDFYAGSLIISLLSLTVIRWIAETWGPDHILSPSILEVPLADLMVFDIKIDQRDLIPVIPATVMAIIPKGKGIDEIKKDIREELKKFWGNIVKEYIKILKDIISEGVVDEEIEKYLVFENVFPKIRILILPAEASGEGEQSEILVGDSSSGLEVVKYLRGEGLWDKICRIGGVMYPYQPLSELEVLIKILQYGSGYVKYHEETARIPEPGGEPDKAMKCMACGGRNIAFPDKSPAWGELEKKYVVDLGERLCHLCLLKRMFLDILKEIEKEKIQGTVRIPSTDDFSVVWFRASLLALGIASLDSSPKEFREFYECFYDTRIKFDFGGDMKKLLELFVENEVVSRAFREELNAENLENKLSSRLLVELYRCLKNKLEESKDMIEHLREMSVEDFIDQIGLSYILLANPELFFEDAVNNLVVACKKRGTMTKEQEEYLDNLAKKHVENLRKFYKEIRMFVEKNLSIVNKAREKIIEVISDISGIDKELLCELLKPLSRMFESPEKSKVDYSFIPIAFKPLRRFVLLYGDGDYMGRWANGENLGPWILHHHPTMYKDILNLRMPSGFKKDILTRPKPISPSYMFTLSLTLSHGAILVSRIIEAFGGFTIYSGGDDVLAFLPPETWFIVYYLVRVLFSRELGLSEIGSVNNRIKVFTYGMGWRATQSYGVVVAHPKADLRLVKRNVDELLEGVSKKLAYSDDYVKDGLSVRYMGRAGIIDEAIGIPNVLLLDAKADEYKPLKAFYSVLRDRIKENVEQAIPKVESGQDVSHLNAIENYKKDVKGILCESESKINIKVMNVAIPKFIGILPKSLDIKHEQKSKPKPISPLLLTYDIIKYVLNNVLSHTAKQKLRHFYESIRELGLRGSLLHLLRYDLRRKPGRVGQKLENKFKDYVEIIMKLFEEVCKIEDLFSVRSEYGTRKSKIYPLADILFRVLRNTV